MRTLLAPVVIGALVAACTRDGALQQSTFSQVCTPSDGNCLVRPLEAPLAMGARLDLQARLAAFPAETAPPTSLRSTSDAVIVDGIEIAGHAPGLSSVLLLAPGDVVLDFFHVWVGAVTHLELQRAATDAGVPQLLDRTLALHVGDNVTLDVLPFANAQQMGGGFDITASAADPVVSVLPGDSATRVVVSAVAPGETDVVITALGRTANLHVGVEP